MNANTNKTFLETVTTTEKNLILSAIAKHYGITNNEALEEVTNPEAENILDYLTGQTRNVAFGLYRKHGFKI